MTPISRFTGYPEILGGRVKTLTPRVFGGILYDRAVESHQRDCAAQDIPPIDVVVVNLYPFEETIAREGVTLGEAVEQIDVGGPSMLRAAAKNHRSVVVLCRPSLYAEFMSEMERGEVSDEFRRRAAIEVFRRTSEYDAAIASYLESHDADRGSLPGRASLLLERLESLRYGENPQQSASFYRLTPRGSIPWDEGKSFRQLQGKELSYNNIVDLDAAWRIACSFATPAAAVIKHTNPCGAGTAPSIAEALHLAIESDPVSAFGGIIATNREFDAACAQRIGSMFLEVIVAPAFSTEAKQALASKKNLRLIETAGLAQPVEIRSAAGGVLIQSTDSISTSGWRAATKRAPDEREAPALAFAWTVCAAVKSNAIVIAREAQTVGIGAGQMSRVDAARLAITKAVGDTAGCVAASDAFFPFADGLQVLAAAGVTAIIQPGGSVRDEEVIAAADELGIAMMFTGERHFRH